VEYGPTDRWIEGYYPGYPGFADPVDEREYAETPCTEATVLEAIADAEHIEQVQFVERIA